LINQDVETQLFKLTAAGQYGSASYDGLPIFLPSGTPLNSGSVATLMGRPVLPVEYCATLGDAGDIILCDPSRYLFITKGAIKSDMSMHVRFLYGENTYRLTYRCNGQSELRSAVTPFKGSNTLSTIVTLAERA
jgi:HK97 family phage major capsid protein